jgi:MFS family permease
MGKETEFRSVKSRATIFDATANAMAAFLGGFLGAISLRWTVYAIVPVFSLTFLLTLFLREPPTQKMDLSLGDGSFRDVLRFTRNHRPLRHFLPFYSLLAGMLAIAFWLAQKYQGLIETPTWMYGILECSYEAGTALVGMIALWLGSRFGDRRILLLTSVLLAGSYIVCGLVLHVGCIGLLILARSLGGIFEPITCDILNKMPIGGRRATVLSLASLCARFGEVLFCIVAALAIRIGGGDAASFVAVGVVGIAALIAAFLYAIPSFEKAGE